MKIREFSLKLEAYYSYFLIMLAISDQRRDLINKNAILCFACFKLIFSINHG
jgi:hypothetical protein